MIRQPERKISLESESDPEKQRNFRARILSACMYRGISGNFYVPGFAAFE